MKADDIEKHMRSIATLMRLNAWRSTFDGTMSPRAEWYVTRICRRIDATTGTVLIFTRDTGHHTSGWMKNPDYERCLHLSLTAIPPRIVLPSGAQRVELDTKTKAAWLRAFFGAEARYTWEESAKSREGERAGVVHYRLFCDAAWVPLMPRGEVYSSEFTEKGWRSASQVLEEDGAEIVSTLDPT